MNLGRIAAVSAATVTVAGALAYFGLDLPKVASQSFVVSRDNALAAIDSAHATMNEVTHATLTGEIKSVKEIGLENAITIALNRAGDFDVLAIRMKAEGATSRDIRVITDQADAYRNSVNEYRIQLRAIRNK